ncbi:MAG: HD domain-containing protein [Gemmatimonadales bacterium]
MNGYSDRVSHALAFAAKHHSVHAPMLGRLTFISRPANVAIILARHGADEITLVAGVVHHALEVIPEGDRHPVERKINDKFGPAVLAVARDAAECCVEYDGSPVPWVQRKRAMLARLRAMEPRALDICCADEIHECGSAIALAQRLGPEYLEAHDLGSGTHALGWYRDLIESLVRRVDWTSRGMCHELRYLLERLAPTLGEGR